MWKAQKYKMSEKTKNSYDLNNKKLHEGIERIKTSYDQKDSK